MTPLELLELTIEDKIKGIWFGEENNSEFKSWYSNGQLYVHCFYKDGRREDEFKRWHDNELLFHELYKDGKLIKNILL